MELSSFFGRREGSRGFQGVLGAAGTISGRKTVPEKIELGLNRHLRQPFAAISSRIDSYGSPGASGMPPGHFWSKKLIKSVVFSRKYRAPTPIFRGSLSGIRDPTWGFPWIPIFSVDPVGPVLKVGTPWLQDCVRVGQTTWMTPHGSSARQKRAPRVVRITIDWDNRNRVGPKASPRLPSISPVLFQF